MMNKDSISTFQQTGYQCSNCQAFTMTFGASTKPVVCPTCHEAGKLSLVWDHLVTTKTTVEDLLSGASLKPEGIDQVEAMT